MAKKEQAPLVSAAQMAPVGAALDVLARFLACDHKTVQNYAKRGLVVRLGHGRYALMQSVANVVGYLRQQAAGRVGRDENVDAARANAMLKDTQRAYVEMRMKKLNADLISLPEVRAAWAEIALNVKQMFLSLPGRARFVISRLTPKDQDALDRLVRELLDEVAFLEIESRLPQGVRLESDDGRASPSD